MIFLRGDQFCLTYFKTFSLSSIFYNFIMSLWTPLLFLILLVHSLFWLFIAMYQTVPNLSGLKKQSF